MTSSSNIAIQIKKSGETGNTPADLAHGEIAINYADGKLYYKDDGNFIRYITNQDTFGTIIANGSLILATNPTDVLTIDANDNIRILGNPGAKSFSVDLSDNITVAGNVAAQNLIAYNQIYAGIATFNNTPLPNLIAQFTGNTDSYVQINAQNIDPHGSADYVATADVGTDTTFYIDMGIQNSQQDFGNIKRLDGYLYVQGNTGQLGGNLVIGTTSATPNLETRIVAGGIEDENVVVVFNSWGANIANNLYVGGSIFGPTIANLNNFIQLAYDEANAAYNLANTANGGVGGTSNTIVTFHFPIGDYGYVDEPLLGGVGGLEEVSPMYDMRVDPTIVGLISIDLEHV
jgi:hypothetical protein